MFGLELETITVERFQMNRLGWIFEKEVQY